MKSIESGLPDLWSETHLRPYLGEVKRRHGVVETLALPSMRDLPPVQIETLFVPPLLAKVTVSADTAPEVWPEGRALLSELQDFRQLVVLGDPGGGKTTLSNWLAWRLASGLSSPLPDALTNRVPVPCVLREMPVELFTSEVSLVDLACSVSDKLLGSKSTAIIKQSLASRIHQGAYVLILDGIDEIPLNHRQVVAGWIRAAFEQGGCVLATSRIVGYEDGPVDGGDSNSNQISSKKYGEKIGEVKIFSEGYYKAIQTKFSTEFRPNDVLETKDTTKWAHIRYLMPFDQGRIASFVENWYRQRCVSQQEAAQKTTDLLTALSQSDVTQKLARTPNLLSLMAIVHRERAHLPDGKALLYEEIANAYINTIDKQRKIEPGDVLAQYGWKDRKAWLAYVGFKMQSTRNIGGSRDTGILADESDVLDWLTHAMSTSGVISPSIAAQTFLNWVARRSGLLLPRGEARYAFVHLSFQEYFCACYLDSCIVRPAFIKNQLQENAEVTKHKLTVWSGELQWFETLIFLFELLSAERDSEWVDDLFNTIFGESSKEFAMYDGASDLASRIIKNKHIKISSYNRDLLASRLGKVAVSEWLGERYTLDSVALSALMDSGYAVALGTPPEVVFGGGLWRGKCVDRLADVISPDRVQVLLIENHTVLDGSFLDKFINVRYLRINGSEIGDVSFLKLYKELRFLQLMSLPVEEINSIGTLNELARVELHDLNVTDIEAIGDLKNLSYLELQGLDVADLSPLAKLNNLSAITVKDLPVTDFTPLANIKSLSTLYVDDVRGADFSTVGGIKGLLSLRVDGSQIEDFSFLKKLKKIRYLDLRRIRVGDVDVIASLKGLDSLYFIACDVSDLAPLAKLSGLRSFGLMHMALENIEFLAKMQGVRSLYLFGIELRDFTPISYLKELYSLSVDAPVVPELTPLSKCKELRFLDIECQSAVDVLPLKKLPLLHNFNLKSKSVANLESLSAKDGLSVTWEESA